jgi:hypothetical protein
LKIKVLGCTYVPFPCPRRCPRQQCQGCRRAARYTSLKDDGPGGARLPACSPAPCPSPSPPRGWLRQRGCRRAVRRHLQHHQDDGPGAARLQACSPVPSPSPPPPRGRPRGRTDADIVTKMTTSRVRGCWHAAQRHLHSGVARQRRQSISTPVWRAKDGGLATAGVPRRNHFLPHRATLCDGTEDDGSVEPDASSLRKSVPKTTTRRQPACIRRYVHHNEPCCPR